MEKPSACRARGLKKGERSPYTDSMALGTGVVPTSRWPRIAFTTSRPCSRQSVVAAVGRRRAIRWSMSRRETLRPLPLVRAHVHGGRAVAVRVHAAREAVEVEREPLDRVAVVVQIRDVVGEARVVAGL